MGTVLIVDDDPEILESTAQLVRALGHRACTTRRWEDVRRLVGEIHPDVVLHDARMPGLDLAAQVGVVRAGAGGAPLRFLVFSGADGEFIARAAGADGALAKPFGVQEMLRALPSGPSA